MPTARASWPLTVLGVTGPSVTAAASTPRNQCATAVNDVCPPGGVVTVIEMLPTVPTRMLL
jgi:hypothetical protein